MSASTYMLIKSNIEPWLLIQWWMYVYTSELFVRVIGSSGIFRLCNVSIMFAWKELGNSHGQPLQPSAVYGQTFPSYLTSTQIAYPVHFKKTTSTGFHCLRHRCICLCIKQTHLINGDNWFILWFHSCPQKGDKFQSNYKNQTLYIIHIGGPDSRYSFKGGYDLRKDKAKADFILQVGRIYSDGWMHLLLINTDGVACLYKWLWSRKVVWFTKIWPNEPCDFSKKLTTNFILNVHKYM